MIVPETTMNALEVESTLTASGIAKEYITNVKVKRDEKYVNTFHLDLSVISMASEFIYSIVLSNVLTNSNRYVFFKGQDDENWKAVTTKGGSLKVIDYPSDPRREAALSL